MSVERKFATAPMDVKSKLAQDMKKLTSAASKLRIHSKRSKSEKEKKEKQLLQQQQQQQQQQETRNDHAEEKCREFRQSSGKDTFISRSGRSASLPSFSGKPRLPPDVVAVTRVQAEKKWTMHDLLHCIGVFVRRQTQDQPAKPSPHDVASWIACADKALQLNGWTINCFLLESHIVFTYMLLQRAFSRFPMRTMADVKELVLMCLYISYTYNANEISYPLRPFLVKQDRVAFWGKCTDLSLSSSSEMLRLNKDSSYYSAMLTSLKSVGQTPISQ